MVKRILSCVLLLSLLFTLCSCKGEEEPVLSHCELRLPLGDDYYEVDAGLYDSVYSNGEYMIALTRISFVAAVADGINETLNEAEFAEVYLRKCSREANVNTDPLAYVDYYDSGEGIEQYFLEVFFRSPYAFFVILFACDASASQEAHDAFLDMALKVYFTT